MIQFKALDTQDEWNWLWHRAHPIHCQDTCGIVAYKGSEIQAVAAFDSWTVDACSVHFAIDNPFVIRAGFLNEIADYLFHTRGRNRLFGLVPSNNAGALKLDAHIGFREVVRIPDAVAEGVDYIVVRMDKEDCRWLSPEFREEAA